MFNNINPAKVSSKGNFCRILSVL